MTEANIFLSNAQKLRDLHDAVHDAVRRREESPAACARWEKACQQFHAQYDALAFPGGVDEAFRRVEAGDADIIELIVQFLEADPFYFRSGYHKENFINQICKQPLLDGQKKRLQQVILAQIRNKDRREFRAYCRLARAVTDPSFREQVKKMSGDSRGTVPRHARKVLDYLNSPLKPDDKNRI